MHPQLVTCLCNQDFESLLNPGVLASASNFLCESQHPYILVPQMEERCVPREWGVIMMSFL